MFGLLVLVESHQGKLFNINDVNEELSLLKQFKNATKRLKPFKSKAMAAHVPNISVDQNSTCCFVFVICETNTTYIEPILLLNKQSKLQQDEFILPALIIQPLKKRSSFVRTETSDIQ